MWDAEDGEDGENARRRRRNERPKGESEGPAQPLTDSSLSFAGSLARQKEGRRVFLPGRTDALRGNHSPSPAHSLLSPSLVGCHCRLVGLLGSLESMLGLLDLLAYSPARMPIHRPRISTSAAYIRD